MLSLFANMSRTGRIWSLAVLAALSCRGEAPAPAKRTPDLGTEQVDPGNLGVNGTSGTMPPGAAALPRLDLPRLPGVSPVPVKLAPRIVTVQNGTAALEQEAWGLFAPGRPSFHSAGPAEVNVGFGGRRSFDGLSVVGDSDGRLSVVAVTDGRAAPVPGLTDLDLQTATAGRWNRFRAALSVDAESIVLAWHPNGTGAERS